MFRRIIFLTAIFTPLFPIIAAPAFGGSSMNPAVDKVVIRNNSDSVQVSFEIKNAFTKDIEEGIKSGIPMTFRHTVKYDTLKEEYEIVQGEKPIGTDLKSVPIRVKEIEQAKKIMAGGDNIIIKPASALKKGEGYQIRIKATLDPVNLPFPLNYMLFFVSFWNYETGWYEKEFVP